MNQLTTTPKAQAKEVATSCPVWLARSVILMGTVLGQNGSKRRCLSAGSKLSQAERAQARAWLDKASACIVANPNDEADKAPLIAALLFEDGKKNDDKISTDLRAETFRLVLEDIPAWVLSIATRRWFRGEVTREDLDGKIPNTNFAPSPQDLRKICLGILNPVRKQVRDVQDLLDAKPLDETLKEASL